MKKLAYVELLLNRQSEIVFYKLMCAKKISPL